MPEMFTGPDSNPVAVSDTNPLPVTSMIPGGLRIGRGTKDKIQVRIADDLPGLVTFTVRVAGAKHYPTV